MITVIDSHVQALIQCECGEYLTLSGSKIEVCENCPHSYVAELTIHVVPIEKLPSEMALDLTEA